MKGVISGIKRMESHDGDGLRTTIFFKGCPLKCIWCHNPESISFKKQVAFYRDKCIQCGICKGEHNDITAQSCPADAMMLYGTEYEVDDLVDILMQDEAFFRNSGGGITLSGGECLAQPDFAVAVAKKIKEKGISVYVDTCGFVNREVLQNIIPYIDKFLYDIKAIDSNVHKKCTGMDNELILENLKFLSERGCTIEIRYPLVKGYNDGECEGIGVFLSNLKGISKVKVLQYHHFAASRYQALAMKNTLPDTETTYEDVESAIKILKKYGLNAVKGMIEN